MDILNYRKIKHVKHELDDVKRELDEHKLKIAAVDKELDGFQKLIGGINYNQEPKQKVNGYGIIPLPKNAANGQVSDVVIKGNTYTNLVRNGNFAQGTTGWVNAGSTLSVNNNILSVIGTGSVSNPRVFHRKVLGNKTLSPYIKLKVRVTNSVCSSIQIYWNKASPSLITTINNPVENQWYEISVKQTNVVSTEGNLYISHVYADAETANGKVMEVQEVLVIDMDAHGLQNLTADEMNAKFPHYFNGTKSTNSVRVKSIGKNLMPSFDEWDIGDNLYVNPNEVQVKFPNSFFSPFIKINPNTNYILSFSASNTRNRLVFYDNNKNVLEETSNTLSTTHLINHQNASYVRWRYASSSDETEYRTIKNMQLEYGTTATEYEPYKESSAIINLPEPLRSVPSANDELNVTAGVKTQNVSEDIVVSDTVYDTLDTSTYTNVDVVITTAFADAKAGTTGADGQTHYYNKDGVELAEVAEADIDLEASAGKYYWGEDKKLYIIVAKGDYADIAAARTGLDVTSLNYQLAQEQVIPVQVSGTLVSYPSGTVYIEPYVADAGIYTDKMEVLHQDLPIKALEKLSKIDFMTGLETELDITAAVIAEDKLSFTHPDLTSGDIVFFVYEHGAEGTIPETEISYYDSRYVVKDDVTEKFYKWAVAVADGVPSIKLVEV